MATNQLVVFVIDGERYGVSIDQVQEIIRYAPPRSVSSDDPRVRGVINLRSRIIPVLDLASHLGVSSSDNAAGNIVIVETNSATVGIVVDEVDEVLSVSPAQVEDLPVASSCSRRIAKTDDALILILGLEDLGISGGMTELAA
jgi:purine-binding chemotaxis protein CheW